VKVENGRDNLTLPRKDGAELEKSGWVSIEADGEDYLFNASGDMTQFKAVFKSKRGEDIQVYVYD